MRLLALGLCIALGGCASLHAPLDAITPDELTVGQGQGDHYGKVQTHSPDWGYEGESETTYAALTWDLPTWQGHEDGLSRETQRNLALLADQLVAEELQAEEGAGGILTLAEGAKPPPMWLLFAAGGLLIVVFVVIAVRSNREDQW